MHKTEIQNSNYWCTEDNNSSQHEGVIQEDTFLMTNHLCQDAQGRGTRHVVYWNHPYDASTTLKVNLITYANDILQVTGATFLLWVLENYQQMAAQVKISMEQVSYH